MHCDPLKESLEEQLALAESELGKAEVGTLKDQDSGGKNVEFWEEEMEFWGSFKRRALTGLAVLKAEALGDKFRWEDHQELRAQLKGFLLYPHKPCIPLLAAQHCSLDCTVNAAWFHNTWKTMYIIQKQGLKYWCQSCGCLSKKTRIE